VFAGGEDIIYAIKPNGDMDWYRHDGRREGTDNWTGPKQVGGGMDRYQSVFPGGEGIIYGINPDGTLDRTAMTDGAKVSPGTGRLSSEWLPDGIRTHT